jgi:Asp-tRNA(Asn)/Glu-tRNA(Gln) amidotransferase A subunit family amidase
VRGMMLRLTQLFNLTGHPALAIPMGVGSAGLPSSIQLVGCRLQTDALLRVALACESYITGVLSPRSGALGG